MVAGRNFASGITAAEVVIRKLFSYNPRNTFRFMNLQNPWVWVVGGVAILLIAAAMLKHFFSEDARILRRKRKSNTRVVSKSRRPTVRFSVNTDKKKK